MSSETGEKHVIQFASDPCFPAWHVIVGLRRYAVVFLLMLAVSVLDIVVAAHVEMLGFALPTGLLTFLAVTIGGMEVLSLATPDWALKRRIARAKGAESWAISFSEKGVRARRGNVMTLEFSWELLHLVRFYPGQFLGLHFGRDVLMVPLSQLDDPIHAFIAKAIDDHKVKLAGNASWLGSGRG